LIGGKISGTFRQKALSLDGSKCIAGSFSGNGIYYSSDSGTSWTQSNIAYDWEVFSYTYEILLHH
jgi:hypothetical protein